MRLRLPVLPLLGLTLLLTVRPAAAQRLPPGFEDLAGGHAERVEVRAFGRSAGLWPVWVTLDHVQIEQPAQVLAALGLADDAQTALFPALSVPLPRDSQLACLHAQPQPGCGWRAAPDDPATVTAIFDEAESVLLLFPSPYWLPQAAARPRFHQASAQARNALLHQQVMHLSGGPRELAFNLHGRAALGVGRAGHLGGSWNHARWRAAGTAPQARTDVDALYYRHDLGSRHYVQLGRIDRGNLSSPLGGQFGLGLLPLGRMQGVRAGTTLAYVDTEALDDAVPVSVLLGRDARVDVFDGARLLQTFYLPAGVSTLDTRLFPPGSYLLTLRIHEDGRFVRSETVPFQRSVGAGHHTLQWFVQGGRQREPGLPGPAAPVLQAGLRLPLAGGTSLGLGFSHVDGSAAHELRAGLRRAWGAVDLHADLGLTAANDGGRGGQAQLSVRHQVAWNAYHQRMRGGACDDRSGRVAGRASCVDATSASVSLPLLGGSLHLGHTRRRSALPALAQDSGVRWDVQGTGAASGATRSLQASYSRTRAWRGLSVATRASVWRQRSADGRLASADHGVQWSIQLARLDTGGGRTRLQRAGTDVRQRAGHAPEPHLRLGQTWQQEQDESARVFSAELGVRPGGALDALASTDLRRRWGQGGLTLALSRADDGLRSAWSAHHSTALALSSQGLFWGAADGADAGVVVTVDTDLDTDQPLDGPAAEVQAGHRGQFTVRFGERRLLPVNGYQRHPLRVQDVSADAAAALRASIKSTELQPFLLPGRLMLVPVSVAATHAYLGMARDEAGEGLAGASILNAALPALGDHGEFLAEFEQRQTWLYLLHGERLLQCPLQVRERRAGLLRVGTVACMPLAAAQLPASISAQPHVQRLLSARLPSMAGHAAAAP